MLLFEGAPLLPIFGMLLFVKQRFVDQIRAGTKTWEIRYGARYRNVRPGDSLSINGRLRLNVECADVHTRASLLAAGLVSETDLADCYGAAEGPFYVFHFKPPTEESSPQLSA
jgi:hypothetical protein